MLDRATKWSRRHLPIIWAVVAGLVLLALTSSISTVWIWRAQKMTTEALAQAQTQTARAEQHAEESLWKEYVASMYPLQAASAIGDIGQLERLLSENRPRQGEPDFRGWEWTYLEDQCAQAFFSTAGSHPVWHPEREELAVLVGQKDQLRIEIWNAIEERCVGSIPVAGDEESDFGQWSWSGAGEPLTIGYEAENVAKFSGPAGLKWIRSGQQLCCGFSSGRVAFYDRTSGAVLAEHSASKQNMRSFDVSRDGKLLATCNWQGKIEVWDVTTGKQLRVVGESKTTANSTTIAFNPTATQLAAAHSWGVRKTWDTSSWKAFEYVNPTSSRGRLAWDASGTRFSAADESSFSIFEVNRAEPLATLNHPSVSRLSWVGDEQLVSSGFDHSIKVWNTNTFEYLYELRLHDSPVSDVAVSPSKQRLASWSNGRVKICALQKPAPQATVLNPQSTRKSEFHFIEWGDTNNILASGHQEIHGANAFLSPLRIWNVNEQNIRQEQTLGALIRSLALSASAKSAWITSIRGEIIQMDCDSGDVHTIDKFTKGAFVSKSSLSPDETRLALGDRERIKLLDLQTLTLIATLDLPYRAAAISWSPNSQQVAVGAWNHLIVWNPANNQSFKLENQSSLSSIAWAPNNVALVVGRRDGDIVVVDVAAKSRVESLRGHRGDVTGLDWAANGRRIASASIDGSVRVWDVATGDLLITFEHPEKQKFLDVEWSPDDRRLAAGDNYGNVFIWGSSDIESCPSTAQGLASGALSKYSSTSATSHYRRLQQ